MNWVRSALRRAARDSSEVELKGLDDVKVTAALSGYDLEYLTLDATRTKLTLGWQAPPVPPEAVAADTPEAEIIAREPGIMKNFRFTARPLRIERSPLNIDLQAFDVPISWLTAAEPVESGVPESVHALVPDDDLDGLRGTFHIDIASKDLVPLITSVARPMLREGGFHLGRLRLDVTGDGADGIRITAYAGVRWKLLIASARGEARIGVTNDAVITVRDLTLGSRNPLVKVALLFARKHVRTIVDHSIDLNEMIAKEGAKTRVHDVHVGTGEQLSLEGRFG